MEKEYSQELQEAIKQKEEQIRDLQNEIENVTKSEIQTVEKEVIKEVAPKELILEKQVLETEVEELRKELEEKVRELTKEEIKDMLIISVEHDAYSAKCFAMLLLENERFTILSSEENVILEKFIDLLSIIDEKKAVELIKSNF